MDPARQVEPHQRAVLAFDLDPAIVQFDETVDEGEAQPRSGALARTAPGFEFLEHGRLHVRRDAGPVVGDGELDVGAGVLTRHLDVRVVAARVLQGVSAQTSPTGQSMRTTATPSFNRWFKAKRFPVSIF